MVSCKQFRNILAQHESDQLLALLGPFDPKLEEPTFFSIIILQLSIPKSPTWDIRE